jgi:hypothetical protein
MTVAPTIVSQEAPSLMRQFACWLDRGTSGLMLVLGVTFAVEMRTPLIRFGSVMVLTNIEALLALALIMWIGARLVVWQIPRIPPRLALPALAWIGLMLLSTALAPAHQLKALLFVGRMAAGLLAGWMVFDIVRTPGRWRALATALAAGGVIVAVVGLLEAGRFVSILNWLLNFKVAPTQVGDVLRVSSTLSYATIAAMVLELTLPLMIALLVTTERVKVRVVIGAGIMISLATLVLTLSRAGILALAAGLIVLVVYAARTGHRTLARISIGAGLLLVLFSVSVVILNPNVILRLSSETEQSWYQAQITSPASIQMRPRERVQVDIRIENSSLRTWEADGPRPFRLGYHLLSESGDSVSYDGERTQLPYDLAPGESVTIAAWVAAPDASGSYIIEWDMMQETVAWFSWKGAPTSETYLNVRGAAVAGNSIERTAPPTDIHIVQPAPVRFDLWRAALLMTVENPLLGVGPDNFRWQYGTYAGLNEWNTDIHANNLYFEWLADTGVIGFAAFMWLSTMLLIDLIRGLRAASNPSHALLILGCFASITLWFVHGIFDSFYEFTPTYLAFWLVAGLGLAIAQGEQRDAHRV